MYYPYVFECTVEGRLIKDGRLVESLIESSTMELITEFEISNPEDGGKNGLSLNAL
jgi:hypothetical protein